MPRLAEEKHGLSSRSVMIATVCQGCLRLFLLRDSRRASRELEDELVEFVELVEEREAVECERE